MPALKPDPSPPLRLLFIGNSHTHTYDIPHMIGSLVRAKGFEFPQLSRSTGEGVGFRWHWNRRETRQLIEQGGWDWIVMQGRSRDPLAHPEELADYAGRLIETAQAHTKHLLLCQTWLPRPLLAQQKAADAIYERLATGFPVTAAKLGKAWAGALALKPDFPLYQPDELHAAPAGAYLTACLLVMHLYGIPPKDWPARIERAGEVLVDLSPYHASWLQQIALRCSPLGQSSDFHP